MRAACGWERGRSGQGKYNEEACRSGGVSAWRGRSGWMREGGGAGAQVWKGGCTKHCEGQVVGGGGLEGAGTRGNDNVRRQQPQTNYCG